MNLAIIFGSQWPDVEVTELCEHTSEVVPGCAFFAAAQDASLAQEHGARALEAGAAIVISQHPLNLSKLFVFATLPHEKAELAAKFYGYPGDHMECIAVTGTNGKTSVAYYVAGLSNLLNAPCGYIGTLGWGCLDSLRDANMTTPNATAMQRNLSALRRLGCERVAIEVSSHALAQERAHHVPFKIGVFTNLTRDHLDYHGTMDAYAGAKLRLFQDFPLRVAILSMHDSFSATIAAHTEASVEFYGPHRNDDAEVSSAMWTWRRTNNGERVSWCFAGEETSARLITAAEFTLENITAAFAVMHALGHSASEIAARVEDLPPVPGRMQIVANKTVHGTVVVDYAHTPDALSKALQALRSECAGQLICVIGCGGDRDRGKRPEMAAAAVSIADLTWLTADNPRSEAPSAIVQDMRAGVTAETEKVRVELDRREAIRKALLGAGVQDVVLIAGKGHEDYQEIGNQRLPFDDAEVARSLLGDI